MMVLPKEIKYLRKLQILNILRNKIYFIPVYQINNIIM